MVNTQLFPILTTSFTDRPSEFVRYWKRLYQYPNMDLYNNNIHVPELSVRNLYDLFVWKNGMNLSSKKQPVIHKMAKDLEVINQLRNRFDEDLFQRTFGWMTTIWKIYLLHIIQPEEAPIFDQHVHRAYSYIHRHEKDMDDVVGSEDFYYRHYIPFFWNLCESCTDHRRKDVDDALWSFGRFLKTYPNVFL